MRYTLITSEVTPSPQLCVFICVIADCFLPAVPTWATWSQWFNVINLLPTFWGDFCKKKTQLSAALSSFAVFYQDHLAKPYIWVGDHGLAMPGKLMENMKSVKAYVCLESLESNENLDRNFMKQPASIFQFWVRSHQKRNTNHTP